MSLRPTTALPQLDGLGVNVRATIPGHPVDSTDGHRRWLLGYDDDQIVIEEDRDHGVYLVRVPYLPEPLTVLEETVTAAAAGVTNLFRARIHDAVQAMETADEVVDPVRVRLLCMAGGVA